MKLHNQYVKPSTYTTSIVDNGNEYLGGSIRFNTADPLRDPCVHRCVRLRASPRRGR